MTIPDEIKEECVGQCEVCDKELFEGDLGLNYDDGVFLCADHAPTWANVKAHLERQDDMGGDDEKRRAAFMVSYGEHIDAGRSPDDKYTVPL